MGHCCNKHQRDKNVISLLTYAARLNNLLIISFCARRRCFLTPRQSVYPKIRHGSEMGKFGLQLALIIPPDVLTFQRFDLFFKNMLFGVLGPLKSHKPKHFQPVWVGTLK